MSRTFCIECGGCANCEEAKHLEARITRLEAIVAAEQGRKGLPGWTWAQGREPLSVDLWHRGLDAMVSRLTPPEGVVTWKWALTPPYAKWGEVSTALEAMEAAEAAWEAVAAMTGGAR